MDWLSTFVGKMYPGAPRVIAQFEVEPANVYPKAALAKRWQAHFTVPVVIHEDGRVELVPNTFFDPIFAPAIVASLASARAEPVGEDGSPRIAWALLTYMFEPAGER